MARGLTVSFKVKPVPGEDFHTGAPYVSYRVPDSLDSRHLSERPSWASRDLAEVFAILRSHGIIRGESIRSDRLPACVSVKTGSLLATVSITFPTASHWRELMAEAMA